MTAIRPVLLAILLTLAGIPAAGAATDEERVLSPDGRTAVFTRFAAPDGERSACPARPKADELWRSRADGSGAKLLLRGRGGERPEENLCLFQSKQFSSDGQRLLFLSPAWVTSDALHEIDLRTGRERYLLPANDFVVLSFCKGENKDRLAVMQHRYFQFGGSYDWYWLYSADGRHEIGPLGEFADREELLRRAHEDWCEE